MDPGLARAVEEALAEATGEPVRVTGARPVSGGSINRAYRVEVARPRAASGEPLSGENPPSDCWFVKANPGAPDDFFEAEAAGLAALRQPEVVRRGELRVPATAIPGTVSEQSGGETPFLILEAITPGSRTAGMATAEDAGGFWQRFGAAFATLHRQTAGDRFGLGRDNYIGATPQPNGWFDDGCALWRHRLGDQLHRARESGHTDRRFDRLGERLLDRLDRWLDLPGEPACLLHGDLWSGNYLVDEHGTPVLIDPAVSHGHREADLAMCRLFGGFDHHFYAAYEEVWPLPPGAAERLPLYQLYHLLNHLNLFGTGYRGQCLAVLERFGG